MVHVVLMTGDTFQFTPTIEDPHEATKEMRQLASEMLRFGVEHKQHDGTIVFYPVHMIKYIAVKPKEE